MNNKTALLIVTAVIVLSLTGCNIGGAWNTLWSATEATPTPAPDAAVAVPAYTDFCENQINPAWAKLIEKNTLQKKVYEAWVADVTANGGMIFGASKCSIPVDSRIFGPGETVSGSGPTQLVTDYRFTAIWHPEVNATYKLAAGCTFKPLFSQGDAPVAVWIAGNTVTVTNNVSNGVSLVGLTTCSK